MDEIDQVGPRLRLARQARGHTLAELAGLAGMSASTLSRLESGKRQASLELLLPLTRHLGITIDQLLRTGPRDPRVRRPEVRSRDMVLVPLSPEGSAVETFRVVFPGQHTAPAPKIHDGREWIYVLSGRLRLVLGDQELIIEPGDAAEFDTQIPHSLSGYAGQPAEVISIFSPDGIRLHVRTPAELPDGT